MLTKDLVIYLQDAKIDLVINITGMKQDNLTFLEQKLQESNITPVFFFINQHDSVLKSKTKIIPILHGVDLFLGNQPKQYDIEYGIFIDRKSEEVTFADTYHFLTNYDMLIDNADIFLPAVKLNALYPNYKHIVFQYFNGIFPQIFFDAAFYNGSVFFNVDDRTSLDNHLRKLLQREDACKLSDMTSGNIRDSILKKHTCLHRTKSLLSQLSCGKYIDELQGLIERSIK
jgi:hypothetical protein